jgi:hypothetical protein
MRIMPTRASRNLSIGIQMDTYCISTRRKYAQAEVVIGHQERQSAKAPFSAFFVAHSSTCPFICSPYHLCFESAITTI